MKLKKILALVALITASSLGMAKEAKANCVGLIGWPLGLAFPSPCPVFDSGLKGAFSKQNVQAAKSLLQSARQLQETMQQLRNSISILESLFMRSVNLRNSFTNYDQWNSIPYHTNISASSLFSNFHNMVSSFQINGENMIGNLGSTSKISSWEYAMQTAINSQVYAMSQQSYDAKNNRSDFEKIASAVTKSKNEQEDWNANLAIHLKIIQQLEIRNTLLARLASVRASQYSLPLQARFTRNNTELYAPKTSQDETIIYH